MISACASQSGTDESRKMQRSGRERGEPQQSRQCTTWVGSDPVRKTTCASSRGGDARSLSSEWVRVRGDRDLKTQTDVISRGLALTSTQLVPPVEVLRRRLHQDGADPEKRRRVRGRRHHGRDGSTSAACAIECSYRVLMRATSCGLRDHRVDLAAGGVGVAVVVAANVERGPGRPRTRSTQVARRSRNVSTRLRQAA